MTDRYAVYSGQCRNDLDRSYDGRVSATTGYVSYRYPPVSQTSEYREGYGKMQDPGRIKRGDELDGQELEEIRRDICAVVSKLDLMIAGSPDPAAPDER